MEKILQHFFGYLTAERGLSRNSTAAYSSDLEDYVQWLYAQGIESFDAAGRDAIIDYLEYCRDERALETVSIARRLVAIKILYRYLFRERLIAADVTDVMDSPKFWRILPDFLSVPEVDALLNAFPVRSSNRTEPKRRFTHSLTRSPQEYSSSRMQRLRMTSGSCDRTGYALSRASTSATFKKSGRMRQNFGESITSVTSAAIRRSRKR